MPREAVFEEKKVEETDVAFVMDRFGYAKLWIFLSMREIKRLFSRITSIVLSVKYG